MWINIHPIKVIYIYILQSNTHIEQSLRKRGKIVDNNSSDLTYRSKKKFKIFNNFNVSIESVMLKYVSVPDDERNVETCSMVV